MQVYWTEQWSRTHGPSCAGGERSRELRASGGRAQRGPRARSNQLTAQQLQDATMVAEGPTNKNVANSLFLSPRTIQFHLHHIYLKLGVTNRIQLARC
jgi:DNA-binding NarL/FixJ family response regulator